jgi:serine/threonine protein kinase
MNNDLTLDLNSRPSGRGDVPAAPDAWGRFKLLARVGYGGFGEVYRAWDPDLEREVALKLLLPSASGNSQTDEEYNAMLREARALASVRHPNIVPVYGIDRHDGRVGFWTDFVKGRTLSSVLAAQGAFGYREAALIGLDVTRALSAVHRAGILHRDIKAENVMREEGGRILLMDFGLSTLPNRQIDIAGTPNYMAPELWQGQAASVETDLYAVGVLLFHLVTGEYPAKLGGLSVAQATAALPKRRTLMDLRSDLPESYLRTVSRAMEIDVCRRFGSVGQLAEALAESLGTAVPVEVRAPIDSAPKLVPTAESRPALAPWMKWGIAAVFVVGGAGLKMPAMRTMLHLDATTDKVAGIPSTSSTSSSDRYTKATRLLQKSYKDSNVADAMQIFKSIPESDPNFALAQAGLGAAYFTEYKNSADDGSFRDLAKAATKRALDLDPNLAPALVTMAQIDASLGDSDLALTKVNQVIKANPRSPEAHAALAEVYKSQGNLKDAIASVQRSIDIDGENSTWWVRQGDYYKSTGDLEAAVKDWQTATEKDPENIFASYNLGIADQMLDKLPEARRNFQKVLQLSPKDEYSYRALGTVFELEGNYADAEKTDREAIKLNAGDYQAWLNLGNVYAWSALSEGNRHKHQQALDAYEKAIQIAERQRSETPNSKDLVIDLANLYASAGNKEKSLPFIRKALALAGDDPEVQYLAGYSYELLGHRSEAIPLIASSIAQGGPAVEVRQSPELAALRDDPAFRAALQEAQARAKINRKAN